MSYNISLIILTTLKVKIKIARNLNLFLKTFQLKIILYANSMAMQIIISMNDILEMKNKFNKKWYSGPSVIPNQILDKCLNGFFLCFYTFFSTKFFDIKN